MGDMSYFAETVAINRGMPVKMFRTVGHARDWLLEQAEGPDEQHIFQGDD